MKQFALLQFVIVVSIMTSQINRQVRLEARPNGIPQPDHFEIVAAELPEIADNQVVVRIEYPSVEAGHWLGVHCGMFRRWRHASVTTASRYIETDVEARWKLVNII